MTDERPSSRRRPPEAPCLNCGNTTPGAFCPQCGQRKTWVRVSVRAMLADVLEDQLVMNRALPRTVTALLFRPGLLTQEYVRGRIVSYIAPFRLFLVTSVIFFVVLSFIGLAALERAQIDVSTIPMIADSARAELVQQRGRVAQVDTTKMDEAAREPIRRRLAGLDEAIASISDTMTVLDSAHIARIRALSGRQTQGIDSLGRQPWARQMNVDSNIGWLNDAVKRKFGEVAHLPPREALRAIVRDALEFAPHVVFALMPFFALLLKLLYIRRRRYYAEHFVFALHVHAFSFAIGTLVLVLPWEFLWLPALIWMALYVWLAMKRVYAQGWIRTTLKWWTLGWLYLFLLLLGVIALFIVTFTFS